MCVCVCIYIYIEPCHQYEGVIAHMNASRHTQKGFKSHTRKSHVTITNESRPSYERVLSHMNASFHVLSHECDSSHTYVRGTGTSHIRKSRVQHECIKSHSWTRHATHIKKVMSRIKKVMSHIVWRCTVAKATDLCLGALATLAHMNVISHSWTKHVTHLKESCHIL